MKLIAVLVLLAAQDAPKGRLVVVGGGEMPAGVRAKALELAGGKDARVLVIAQASERKDAAAESAAAWKAAGATSVESLDLADAKAAVAQVKRASLVWMGGGDQNRLMKALEKTGVPEAIRERHREGAVVGGTSAGAAVMSKVMITGEAELDRIEAGATKTSEGLGLWEGVIVDQHFVKRSRMNRLISAVLDKPELVGVGIDEETAAVVGPGGFEVMGKGSVVVVDARNAKRDDSGGATDVTLHVLKAGMKWGR
jgi:cyanophycinase